MPMFDFLCSECGRRTNDRIVTSPLPPGLPCPCGASQTRLAGNFSFFGPVGERAPIDDPKEIFAGIEGLEDTDGVNQAHYKSKKITMDMGQ